MSVRAGFSDRVDFVCLIPEHVAIGRRVPDTQGTLTIHERRWAYCCAGLQNASHQWHETGGVRLADIRHSELPRLPKPS